MKVTETMFSGRILGNGPKVETLPFRLSGDRLFSVFLMPKEGVETEIELIDCELALNGGAKHPFPVNVGSWSPGVFLEISDNNPTLLDDYDVYWGTAQKEEV